MSHQSSLYVVGTGADSACYLKYRSTDENGKRVRKTALLCKRDGTHDWYIKRPKLSLSTAHRILFEQGRIAFEIGQRSLERGVRRNSVRGFVEDDRRLTVIREAMSRKHRE